MTVLYSDFVWRDKLMLWNSKGRSRLVRITRNIIEKVSRPSIKKCLCKIFGYIFTIGYLLKRMFYNNSYAANSSPNVHISNDNELIMQTSKAISIRDFVSGSVIYTSRILNNQSIDCRNSMTKFLLESRDFIFQKNKFNNDKVYDEAIQVVIDDSDQVTINGFFLNQTPNVIVYRALYQVIVLQRYISHLLFGNLICTYGYNILKMASINKYLHSSPLIKTIFKYGRNNRNYTESHLKFSMLLDNFKNPMMLDDEEIDVITQHIESADYEEILFSDWRELFLVVDTSVRIYEMFMSVVSLEDQLVMTRVFKKSNKQCINFLTNMLYSLTYHHNKSNRNLAYISSFLDHNTSFDSYIRNSNNSFICTNDPFINLLRNKANIIKQGEGFLIFDSHDF